MFADLLSTTLRAACAAGFSLLFVMAAIPQLARLAQKRRFGDRDDKSDSDELNQLHKAKRSTPIVGGIAILGGALGASLLFADLGSSLVWVLLVTLAGLGALGLVDDITKTFGKTRTAGLTARQKLVGQVVCGAGVGLFLLAKATWGADPAGVATLTDLSLPFLGLGLPIGVAGYVLFSTFLVTGTSKAVNLTDGLDGLAGGCALVALGVYMLIALAAGDSSLAASLALTPVAGAAEVGVVLASLVGGLTSFLIFNRHPARVFMGDTGSLALGGVLAVASLLTQQEILLALVGGVFVVEALSVMAQVGSFKLTGKRVLRCAPLHHHFEFKGVHETRIVTGFHTAALILGALSLAGMGLLG